jgi:hypothetical protein
MRCIKGFGTSHNEAVELVGLDRDISAAKHKQFHTTGISISPNIIRRYIRAEKISPDDRILRYCK